MGARLCLILHGVRGRSSIGSPSPFTSASSGECPRAALDAIKGIDAALETVRTFPDAGGHFTDDHLEHEYRTTLAGPYIIYYRYNATTLTVYRIMHQRQSIDTYSLIEY